METKLLLLVVLVAVASFVRAEEEETQDILGIKDELKREKFFFKSYLTTTYTALSILTSAQPYICIQASNAQVCSGRKLRRRRNFSIEHRIASADETRLDHSEGHPGVEEPKIVEGEPDQKFFFTLWKTTTTIFTVTTLSTNKSITLSVSARCTYSGFTTIPTCG